MDASVHSFLRTHRDHILAAWEKRVVAEVREVELQGIALRNDLPPMLDALAGWLEDPASRDIASVGAQALKHVMQRLDEGLSLEQVFREYRLLRETIIEQVLTAEGAAQLETRSGGEQARASRVLDLARLNAGLDIVLSESVVAFVAERDHRAGEERKIAENALRELNDQLRVSDHRKSEFLAMLSHELRNPLAPIRNGVYLLERAAPSSEQAARAREVIRRQTEHLTRLVDDLFDVTRISHGKILLQRDTVDLRDIVHGTTDDFHSVFTQAGIHLGVDHRTAGQMVVNVDPIRIAQVLTNLLNNALKFTPPGGAVRVSLGSHEGYAELRVTDDGAGMNPNGIETMFEPFTQAEQSLARTKGGLGLGLALVKSLVELHGGTVSARSEGPGRGSELLVRLPLVESAKGRGPSSFAARTVTRSVLIIEDNVDGALSLADILELHGHRVHVARDGASGIALVNEVHPDVVFCDIGLPDIDGYEVARRLRSNGWPTRSRLVALSGYAQPEDRERAREAGFDAHSSKPPDVDELLAVLQVEP